eukprot:scaffold292503_cov48-Prasinocladus_malaysianus.AAC.1
MAQATAQAFAEHMVVEAGANQLRDLPAPEAKIVGLLVSLYAVRRIELDVGWFIAEVKPAETGLGVWHANPLSFIPDTTLRRDQIVCGMRRVYFLPRLEKM